MESSRRHRSRVADRLEILKETVAETITAAFFERHPDWTERYGERGRRHAVEDARFHIEFLAGALQAGSPEAFGDYVRWARRILEARSITAAVLRESLEQIESALLARFPLEEQEELRAAFRAGYEVCDEAPEGAQGHLSGDDWEMPRRLFLQASLRGDRQAAFGIVRELLREGRSIPEVYLEILEPAQYETGRLWECNEITVAEEHMATAVTQSVLGQCYPLLPRSDSSRGKMVLTGPQGERHQVGAHMVADVLEAYGWDVRFLGTNMPHEGILQVIREHRPDWVGISATTLLSLPQVRHLIAEIRDRFGSEAPRIIVGGSVFRFAPRAWQEVGADAVATSLGQAIEILCQDPPLPSAR